MKKAGKILFLSALLCLILFAFSGIASAGGNYTLGVGETAYLSVSSARAIQSCTWVSHGWESVEVEWSSGTSCRIRAIKHITSSPIIVSADYSYWNGDMLLSGRDDFYIYTRQTYVNVSFNANGGSVYAGSITAATGASIGNLPTPTRPGYTFDGWYTSSTGGSRFSGYTTVTQTTDFTLYAHWRGNSYNVVLDGNGSTSGEMSLLSCIYGNSYTLPTVKFEKTGSYFYGWCRDPEGNGTIYADEGSISNLTTEYGASVKLYAIWKDNSVPREKYTVHFNVYGGLGELPDQTVDFGREYGELPTPKRGGHLFLGWYTSSSGGNRILSSTVFRRFSSVTLYARWEKNPYACGDDLLWDLDENGFLRIMGSGSMYNYSSTSALPWSKNLNDIRVVVIETGATSIGNYAFRSCGNLSFAIIPNSVKSIGNYAFYGCGGLTSIVIPNSVTNIGAYAFYACSGLTGVTISKNATNIGEFAFSNCGSLASLTIPDGVTTIGQKAFYKCTGLTGVTIPGSVNTMGAGVFSGCTGLTGVVISEGVATVGESAFSDCGGLTELTLPESLTGIGTSAFLNCAGLTEVTFPANLKTIGDSAFSNCAGLTDVTFPAGLTAIGASAFANCAGLTAALLPEGLTSIGNSAFSGCAGLTEATFPDSLTSIGTSAFSNCGALTNVLFPESLTGIGGSAFKNCTALTTVTIPETVTNIAASAFYNSGLTDVFYYGTEEQKAQISIGSSNDKLTAAAWHYTAGAFGDALFWKLDGKGFMVISGSGDMPEFESGGTPWYGNRGCIVSIVIESGVTNIGKNTFNGCSALADITIPASVSGVGGSSFSGCKKLTTVAIPDGVPTIWGSTFSGCSALASITLPDSVTEITKSAFKNCSKLKNVYYDGTSAQKKKITIKTDNDYLTKAKWHYMAGDVGENLSWRLNISGVLAFTGTGVIPDYESGGAPWNDYLDRILTVDIPYGVTGIGACAFGGCENLAEIRIPRSVAAIGNDAFSGCDALAKVTYGGASVHKEQIVIGSGNEPLTAVGWNCLLVVPTSPLGVSVKATGDKQLTVSWKPVTGATQYNIYRYNGTQQAYNYKGTTFATDPNPTSYTDKGLSPGTDYYYKVVSVLKDVDLTMVSDMSASAGAKAIAAPAVPTGVAAKASGDKAITISWTADSGATQYNVYRYNGTKGDYVYKGTTFAADARPTAYTDTGLYPGTDYYYKVLSVIKNDNGTVVSALSASASAKAIAAPAVPTGVTAKAGGDKQITVSWTAVSGATQYNVYRYNGTSKTYVYKGTVFATDANPTAYADTGLNPGTDYYYKVLSVIKNDNGTVVSALSASASAKAIAAPAAPSNMTAAASGSGAIRITWNAVPGATQYNVYRYNGATKTYAYKGTVFSTEANPTQYVDTGLAAGTTYYYKTVSVIKNDNGTVVGGMSAAVSAPAK